MGLIDAACPDRITIMIASGISRLQKLVSWIELDFALQWLQNCNPMWKSQNGAGCISGTLPTHTPVFKKLHPARRGGTYL